MRIRGGPHSSLPRHRSVVSQRAENHFDWADCVMGGGLWGGLEISKDKGSQACLFPVEIVQRLSRQINMVAAVSSGPKWEKQETCCSENGESGWTRFCRDRDQERGGKLDWAVIWPLLPTHQLENAVIRSENTQWRLGTTWWHLLLAESYGYLMG